MENENVEVVEEKIDETKETKVEKTFTQEEMDKIIAKRIGQVQSKAESERKEAEKLAKMSEAERQVALFNKEKEEFEAQRKQFAKQQMELQITKELSTKGLPLEFVNLCMAETAEKSLENINFIEKKMAEGIEKGVQERLKSGYVPPTSQGGVKGKYTIEDFGNMSVEEINKNWNK